VLAFDESKERVVVPFDESLVARTLELLAAAREVAAHDDAPPPLVDSPKCPPCSLVGLCLPDEVNTLAGTSRLNIADQRQEPETPVSGSW